MTAEDGFPVEAQQGIEGVVSGHLANKVDDGGTGDDVEHQIGDALVPVCVAEALKPGAQIFHMGSLRINWFGLF